MAAQWSSKLNTIPTITNQQERGYAFHLTAQQRETQEQINRPQWIRPLNYEDCSVQCADLNPRLCTPLSRTSQLVKPLVKRI